MRILTSLVLVLAAGVAAAVEIDYAQLPLSFEPNRGQAAPEVRFLSRGKGYTLLLTESAAVMGDVRMRFPRGRRIEALQELRGKVHYYNSKASLTGIPTFGRVAYRQVYPGIDLVFYGNQREIEYDFVVSPGADPRAIRLTFEGAALRLDKDGNLIAGNVVQKAPVAYQDGTRVEARYRIEGTKDVVIALGNYDRTLPLVIDPVVIYSTYVGGSGYDEVRGVATDSSGLAYVTGMIGWQTFVSKIDTFGHAFLYTTFIGGSHGTAIAVDSSDRAYVTGRAFADFPASANAYQSAFAGGGADAFAVRLDALGKLDWATFLGGSQNDQGYGIAVDGSDYPSISGLTESTVDFPTKNPFQPAFAGGNDDAFVARFDFTGTALIFSSYLGGTGMENARGVAVGPGQNVFVTGYSSSPSFPNTNPSCLNLNPLQVDVFVNKVSPAGALLYTKCVGGFSADYGYAIAVDHIGSAYVTGQTGSFNFPVVNAFQPAKSGPAEVYDAFVFKLTPSGAGLQYSTYIGGTFDDYGSSIDVDTSGNAYVAGVTFSRDFPVKNWVQNFGGQPWSDAFLLKLNRMGNALYYSTWLGGTDDENLPGVGAFVAVDAWNIAHVAGNTKSTNFPLAPVMANNPAQPANAGNVDGWVARVQ
jgi:hypothetical protein